MWKDTILLKEKRSLEGVPSAGLQVTQAYEDNLRCSRSSGERRMVQSPLDEKGRIMHSA
jgi:hypothetical protein